jgi:hypothetical protein
MTEDLTKEQVERRIFEALAPLVGLSVVPGSIRQLRPPAPDIECEVIGVGPKAVELVAVDAPQTRRRLESMRTTNEAWNRAFALRSAVEKEALKSRCADMFLSVHFDEAAGARDRTRLMHLIQDRLLGLPVGFSGELYSEIDAPAEVDWAKVFHSNVKDGPHIVSPSAGHWLPPQLEKIQEKLVAKTYRTDAPLELFAYSRHDEVDGHVGGLAAIEECVKRHLPGSQFERVSVFNLGFRQLVYRYPP